MALFDLTQKCPKGNKETFGHDANYRSRWFVFTWFHEEPITIDETMQYLAYGEETCPETGKKHLQGWVYFHNPRYTYGVRKAYRCYMAKMFGSLAQNDDYCSKQGALQEFGTKPTQGERNDIKWWANQIKEGKITSEEIMTDEPGVYQLFGRTLEKIQDVINRKIRRTWVTEGFWLYGPTGSGKSRRVWEQYPDLYRVKTTDKGWWDGYRGQETVLIDDFRGCIPYGELLKMLDRYPYEVSRRGREPYPFLAKRLFITSSMPPADVYHNLAANDTLEQITRRCVVEFVG